MAGKEGTTDVEVGIIGIISHVCLPVFSCVPGGHRH